MAEKPNFVLIQFGHNDQPGKGPERETDPKTTYRENLLRYVEEARQAGAQPILVTSLVRRNFTKDGKIRFDLAPFADAMKEVAAETKAPLVDLHARSLELAERLGPTKSLPLGPPHPTASSRFDMTHLSAEGRRDDRTTGGPGVVGRRACPTRMPADSQGTT